MRPNLSPVSQTLIDIEPRAAFFVLFGQPIPQSYPITIELVSGTSQKLNVAQLGTVMGDDFLVTDVRSVIWRPNAYAGSIFKAQSDVNNALNTNLLARLRVEGGGAGAQYIVNGDFSPLELIAPAISSGPNPTIQDKGWVLTYGQTVKLEAVLQRTLSTEELPTKIFVQLIGWRLGCQNFNGVSRQGARKAVLEYLNNGTYPDKTVT